MDEDLDVELEDLASDEIRELLLEAGTVISAQQAEELSRFVSETGSIEEALVVLEQLALQRH